MMINKVCNICGDVSGRQVTCNGCEQSFCWTHMTDHQQSIEKQMDSLSEKSHLLQQNSNDDSYYNHLFHQIDQWEKESIQKIQLEANTNRDQLKLIIQQSKDIFERSIKQISEEIDHNRQLNNFSEIEIKQFTQQLTDIQSQIQTSFDIQIKEDEQTLPITFIKVKQNTKRPFDQNEQTVKRSRNEANNHLREIINNERFDQVFERPTLSEGNLVAVNGVDPHSIISGTNSYSNGKHMVHFRVEKVLKKKGWNCFFGIKASNENINEDISQMKSVYGFWANGYDVKGGKMSAFSRGKRFFENDDVILTLDCEKKQIQIESKRINRCEVFDIDPHLCPFPWKCLTIIKRCRIRINNHS